jgi:hypothetical protein
MFVQCCRSRLFPSSIIIFEVSENISMGIQTKDSYFDFVTVVTLSFFPKGAILFSAPFFIMVSFRQKSFKHSHQDSKPEEFFRASDQCSFPIPPQKEF